jgi:hypothetical protein
MPTRKGRLVDFLNNVPEFESFLRKAKVDENIVDRILKLASGEIEEKEKKQILDLAEGSLQKPR